jgi:hypothetical protein
MLCKVKYASGLIIEILTLVYLMKKCRLFEQPLVWRVVEGSTVLGKQVYEKYIETAKSFEQSSV